MCFRCRPRPGQERCTALLEPEWQSAVLVLLLMLMLPPPCCCPSLVPTHMLLMPCGSGHHAVAMPDRVACLLAGWRMTHMA